jgi:hypothetical protein
VDGFGDTDSLRNIEKVRATNQADTLIGNASDNSFRSVGGFDTVDGGDGFDRVRYDNDAISGGTSGITVNLASGLALDGFGDTDTLTSIEPTFPR